MPATVCEWLAVHEAIVRSMIEIHRCPDGSTPPRSGAVAGGLQR